MLIILRGISGSGKSTTAKALARGLDNCEIVSRDELRVELFGHYTMDHESMVTIEEDKRIHDFLVAGKHVIVDDTNVRWDFVKRIAAIGKRCEVETVLHLVDTGLDTAIARNVARGEAGGRFVPEYVIRNQYRKLQETKDYTL